MKRCSECEFIYEDDQSVCDLDGAELSDDPVPPSSSQDASTPAAVSPSFFLRSLRSQFALGALMLTGVLSSALVVGYYDSVSQPESTVEPREPAVSLVPSAKAETPDKVTSRLDFGAAALPSPDASSPVLPSSTKSSSAAGNSPIAAGQSSVTGRTSVAPASTTPRGARTRVNSSDSKLKTNRRRLLGQSKRRILQRNERRLVSVSSESMATNPKSHAGNVSSRTGKETLQATARQRELENVPPKEESKVSAMLKKTGRLLTRPFKF